MRTDIVPVLSGQLALDINVLKAYRMILMDPPWAENGGGQCKRGADRHYQTVKKEGILEIIQTSGVFRPHYDGCHLWMWVTSNHLEDGLWLIKQLGFRYVTDFVWIKISRKTLHELFVNLSVSSMDALLSMDALELALACLQQGLGQYRRGSHEQLLFATQGKLPVPPAAQRRSSVILAPRTKHSRKPEEQYQLIEATSPGPYLEMFARRLRPGWDIFGNQLQLIDKGGFNDNSDGIRNNRSGTNHQVQTDIDQALQTSEDDGYLDLEVIEE